MNLADSHNPPIIIFTRNDSLQMNFNNTDVHLNKKNQTEIRLVDAEGGSRTLMGVNPTTP